MTDLARRIENLPPEKRALYEQELLRRRLASSDEAIPRRAPGQRPPLSFSQQRLWFLDQWKPGSPVYNAAIGMIVRGQLDIDALRSAFESVIGRHESLRTVFALDGHEPVQVVLDEWAFDFPEIDLRDLDAQDRCAEVRRLLRMRSRRPFDLARDLMLRATLLRLANEDWILLVEEHHVAFDGWSDVILFREVAELYAAQVDGGEAALPELPIQYADFALWQRERLRGPALDGLVSYWRQQLAGAPSMVKLPLDFPRPEVQTFEGRHLPVALPRSIADSVRELAQSERATPFMTLLAVFATFLYRTTGQDDIVVGTPAANRSRIELENLIGFFSNTLVVRVRLGGNPTFRELLRRVRDAALGAYSHQDLPFEKVVDAVRPQRHAGANPLFQVNFRVQSGPSSALALPGLDVKSLPIDIGFSRFDLALELQLLEEGVGGYLEYNTDLFSSESATRFVADIEHLVTDVLERPDTPLLGFDLSSGAAGSRRPAKPIVNRRARAWRSAETEPSTHQQ